MDLLLHNANYGNKCLGSYTCNRCQSTTSTDRVKRHQTVLMVMSLQATNQSELVQELTFLWLISCQVTDKIEFTTSLLLYIITRHHKADISQSNARSMIVATGASTITITTKWTHSSTNETRIRYWSSTKIWHIFIVSLQIGSEVVQDKQLDELHTPNRSIEETHHDFTTTEQITTESVQFHSGYIQKTHCNCQCMPLTCHSTIEEETADYNQNWQWWQQWDEWTPMWYLLKIHWPCQQQGVCKNQIVATVTLTIITIVYCKWRKTVSDRIRIWNAINVKDNFLSLWILGMWMHLLK